MGKNMKGNFKTRKRVIAFLLSALMVLSLCLPTGGSGVRYNAYAEGEESAQGEGVDIATSGDAEAEESIDEGTTPEFFGDDSSNQQSSSVDDFEEVEEDQNLLGSGQTDITAFVSDVIITENGTVVEKNWTVDEGTSYTLKIDFTEDSTDATGQNQFDMDTRTFSYVLPAGINVESFTSPIPINITNESRTVNDGATYTCSQRADGRYVINGTFADDSGLTNAPDTFFYLELLVNFDSDITQLAFNDNHTYPISVDSSSHVTVNKSVASYDRTNGKITYNVVVNSKRANTNIAVADTLSGTALSFDAITSVTSSVNGNILSNADTTKNVASTTGSNGFNLTIPSMVNNETVTITYTAGVDYSKITGNGLDAETENGVSVTSTQDTTPDTKTITYNNINYTNISKSSSVSSTVSEGKRTVSYTVVYNDNPIVSASGVTLTDAITNNSVTYPNGLNLSIEKYNGNTKVGEATVPATVSSDNKSWSYTINEGSDKTPYKYVIKYDVDVDVSEATNSIGINNSVNDGKNHTAQTWTNVEPDNSNNLTVTKTHSNLDVINRTVDWSFTVTVPDGGLSADTVITDALPYRTLPMNNTWVTLYDEYKSNSLSVTPNISDMSVSTNEQGKIVLTFPTGISNNTGAAVDYTFTYSSDMNEDWIDFSSSDDAFAPNTYAHSNSVQVVDGNKSGTANDSVNVVKTKISKSFVDTNNEIVTADGYPVYKFRCAVKSPDILLNAQGNIVIDEAFDADLTYFSNAVYYTRIVPFDGYSTQRGSLGWQQIPDSCVTPSANGFKLTIPSTYFEKETTTDYWENYWIEYYICVKDEDSFKDLAQRAVSETDDKLTLSNTASIGTVSSTANFDFEYNPVEKSLTNNAVFNGEIDRTTVFPEFEIVLNEAAIELNGGKTSTAIDTFNNLAIIYDTISVSPSNVGITWDMSGNVLSFSNIPDSTKVTITYQARITGDKDTNNKIRFNNDFSYAGSGDNVIKTADVGSEVGGTSSLKKLKVLKYKDGNLAETLDGAEFWLYNNDGTRVTYKIATGTHSVGDPVVIVTGADNNGDGVLDGSGCAWIDQRNMNIYNTGYNNSGVYVENKYYLKEVKAPTDYMIDENKYYFMILNSNNPDYSVYAYVDGDVLKIRNYKPNIYFQKVASDGTTGLEGAEFTLYTKSGSVYIPTGLTAVSDSRGYVSFSDLGLSGNEFTYYIKETQVPSADYLLDDNYYYITFGHDDVGNVIVKSKNIPDKFVNLERGQVGSLTINKSFATDSALNAGNINSGDITFTVEGTGDTTFSGLYDYKNDFDSTGKKTISLAPGSYIVTETSNIEGNNYERITKVKVDSGSAVESDSASVTIVSGEETTVNYSNTYNSLISVTPTAYKMLDGHVSGTGSAATFPLDGLSFGFKLYDIPDSLYPSGSHTNEIADLTNVSWNTTALSSSTADDTTGGKADFDKITYNVEVTDTFPQYYYYKIEEDDSAYSGISKDTDYVVMSVELNKDTNDDITTDVKYIKYNADGSLDTSATDNAKTAAFNNISDSTSLTLTANKYLTENGKAVTPGNIFNFILEPVALNGLTDYQINANQSVTNTAGNVSFVDLSYDGDDISTDSTNPTVYRYKISEEATTAAGYTTDTNYYYVDVTVTRDTTTGGTKAVISKITKYNAQGTAIENNVSSSKIDFTNTRSARTGSIQLSSYKTVDGSDVGVNSTNYNELSFYCVYVGEQSNSLKPNAVTENTAVSGTPVEGIFSSTANIVSFPTISYSTSNGVNTANGTGKHIYKIYEDTQGYSGITNSKDYYIVVVSVTDPGSGTALTTTIDCVYKYEYDKNAGSYKNAVLVSGSGTSNVIFDNTTNSTTLSLQAEKKIAGGTHAKNGFKFKIESLDYDASNGGYAETVTTNTNGIGKFTDLIFNASDVGTYTFTVTETAGNDTAITYDTSVYSVVVEVSIDSTTKGVKAEVTSVTKKADASAAASEDVSSKKIEFTNTLKPDNGSITISAKKELLKAGETSTTSVIKDGDGNWKKFSFILQQVDASGNPVSPVYTQTKQNTVNGDITFDAITYTQADLTGSPYYYKITEASATSFDGYDYSDKVYFVKVDLSENTSNNHIDATATYYKDSIAAVNVIAAEDVVFINEEKESVLSLKAKKELVGASLSNYSGSTNGFAFVAERNGETYTGYNDADGNVVIDINEVFSVVDVVKTNAAPALGGGPYIYTITESSKTGFVCDSASYVAKVTFDFDASGNIVPTVKYYKSTDLDTEIAENNVIFKNTKTGSAELTLTAKKEFKDYPLGTKVFNFELYDGTNTLIQTKQNDTSGNVVFDTLSFTQDDIPAGNNSVTKTFTIKEYIPAVQTQLPGYIYDDKEYTVTVTLTRNEDTGISISHTINDGTNDVDDDDVIFSNKFDTPDQLVWPLSVKKTLEGNSSMEAGMFTFEVYEANSDFVITDNTPKYTAINDKYGNVKFGNDMTGIPTNSQSYYVVKEKVPANTGMLVYDSKEYHLIITTNNTTVTKVERVNSDNSKTEIISGDMTFTNSIDINVKKTDKDGNELSGAVLQVKKNGYAVNTSLGSATTNGITDNTYSGITIGQEYVLTEVSAPVGYAKAADIKFKVEYNSTSEKYELKINTGNGYSVADSSSPITVTMQDDVKKLIINKKIANTDNFLGGATLCVKKGTTVFESAWTTGTSGGTAQNHSIDLNRLTAGTWYTLEETDAPFGYKIAEPVQFMIDSNNKVWSKKSGEADSAKVELTAVNGQYTLVMYDEPLELNIAKYKYGTTTNLTGAKFQIYRNNSSKDLVQSEISVGADGTVALNIITLGLLADTEYILEETKAPSTYELAEPIKFKITSENKLVINDGAAQSDIIIKVYDKPEGTIYICKVDSSKPNENISGALLVVSQDGTEKHRFTSGASAYEIRTSTLTKNKVYILREESAPKNSAGIPTHYVASEIKFYIDNNGVLYVQKSGETGYTAQAGDYADKVVMEDKAREYVKISKIDLTDSKEISGAELKITKADGNSVYEKTVDSNGNLITTSNKLEHTSTGEKWSIDFATFDLDTPYVLTEVTAPDGYEVAESITFKLVEENGKTFVKIKASDGTWVSKENLTVVMEDAPMNNVSFVKIDKSCGEALAGAELTIFDASGNPAYSFTTTSQAKKYRVDQFNVDEEYTLEETGVPTGFYKADDVVFKVSFVTTESGSVRKLFIRDNDGTFKVAETGQIVVEDERIYKVKVSKVDITTEEEVPGAHIQILDETGSIVAEWDSTDSPKEIEGLSPEVTYTLRETVAPKGYKITTDTTFVLKKDGTIDYDKTTTGISSSGVLLVKDEITSLNFTKYGLSYESCAEDTAAYEPLEGVVFEAYAIDDSGKVSDTPEASATSSKNGIVLFEKLPKGKYEIREVKSVGNYKLTEEAFYATVDDNEFAGITDKDGNRIEGNRIINDQYRADIKFTKVSERNQAKKLAGSKYGLYRKNSLGEETLIATDVSDKDGLVVFKGVLLDTNYVIRELESPEGYYISEKPVELSFKLDGTDVVLSTFDDGDKTAVLAANGEITWLEPSVVVSFLKVDEKGNPLAGASLAVLDMNGAPVKDADGKELKWTSTDKAYEIADVFEDGVSYQLVELAAPEGYVLADPVKFEIPADKVGTGENKIITVTMIDKLTTTVTPPEKTTPPSVKTGDTAPIKPVTSMMFISLAGIIYLYILGRRRKNFFR